MKENREAELSPDAPEVEAGTHPVQKAPEGICLNCEFSAACALIKGNKTFCEEYR